jgi:hypothetical protein
MGRPQLPPALVRQKESFYLERQVVTHLHRKSVERGITRRDLIAEILLAWCKRSGMRDARPAGKPRKVNAG